MAEVREQLIASRQTGAVPVWVLPFELALERICSFVADPKMVSDFDLILIVSSRHQALGKTLLATTNKKVLVRPEREHCGDLYQKYTKLSERGCGSLAKASICSKCPAKDRCDYVTFNDQVKAAEVVVEPDFRFSSQIVKHLSVKTGRDPSRILLVLDFVRYENLVATRSISRKMLLDHLACLDASGAADNVMLANVLREMDVAEPNSLPRVFDRYNLAVLKRAWQGDQSIQARGVKQIGSGYRYAGYALEGLGNADAEEIWSDTHGVHFIDRPLREGDVAVFADADAAEFTMHALRHRRPKVVERVTKPWHPQTRIVHVDSSTTSGVWSGHHAQELVKGYSDLVADIVADGKRVALVAGKDPAPWIRKLALELEQRGIVVAAAEQIMEPPVAAGPVVRLKFNGSVPLGLTTDFVIFLTPFEPGGENIKRIVARALGHPLAQRLILPLSDSDEQTPPFYATDDRHRYTGVRELGLQLHRHVVEQEIMRICRALGGDDRAITVLWRSRFRLASLPNVQLERWQDEAVRQALGVRSGSAQAYYEAMKNGRTLKQIAADHNISLPTLRKRLRDYSHRSGLEAELKALVARSKGNRRVRP